MDTNLALTIIGSALILVGVIFNAIPKIINEKIMGELPEDAVNISALFRVVLGGFGIAIGTIAMYCRDLPAEHASRVLFAMGSGFIVVIITIISGKFRGFDENLPLPPIILFTLLTILAYYSS
jgi:hypothetical protein